MLERAPAREGIRPQGRPPTMNTTHCPCGCTGSKGQVLPYAACCGLAHSGERPGSDAEILMRSRYSAFVLGRVPYLLATWHPSTRPATLALEEGAKWLGLEIKQHRMTGDNTAEVEFVARFRVAGRAVRQHERSRFVREDGRWYYVDGDVR